MNDVKNFTLQSSSCHVITAQQSWYSYIREICSYYELFTFLVWRDILVRYKQTALGIAWAVIRPLVSMVILTFIFQRVAHFSSGSLPYHLFVFTGLVPWQFFCDSILFGTSSLLISEQLISKIYFPRFLIPASYVISSFLDCIVSFVFLLIGMALFYTFPPFPKIVLSLLFLGWNIAFSLFTTAFLAAVIVRYRDIRYAVPFLMQMGVYLSPIGFSSSHLSPFMKIMYAFNPLVGIIDGLRWCFFNETLEVMTIVIGLCSTIILSLWSIVYFREAEKTFADII